MRILLCIALTLLIAAPPSPCSACTVMRMKYGEQLIVARNHDWRTGAGLLLVNPRGLAKTAITPVNPASWVARYGSVSFAQFGRELPFAGMNEKGLTVDLLQLGDAVFPAASDDHPSVNVVQWVQYQLDMSASVADVIASLEKINPMPFIAALEKVHYFVTDAQGNVAVIEYLDGKPIVQLKLESACALANSTWQDSATALKHNHARSGSEMRFLRASELSRRSESETPVLDALDGLEQVAQNHTQWSLVYEPQRGRVSFKTRTAERLRWLDLSDLDFSLDSDVLCVDVNADLAGNLQEYLIPFSTQANRRIIDDAFDAVLPAGFIRSTIKEMVLQYGESLQPIATE